MTNASTTPASTTPVAITAARLVEWGTATLGESGARSFPPALRPAWPGAAVAGPALCARCAPGDNLAIHVANAQGPPGSVIVATVGERRDLGYWGEVLTTQAQARGIAGLIIDGGVRDTAALEAKAFPVFSTGVALPGASKNQPGSIVDAVEMYGITVHPGDWVVADSDGVVVVPTDDLDAVMAAADARTTKELEMFERLETGATTIELLGLDASLITRD